MEKNREGFKTNGVERECTKCSNLFKVSSKTVTLCPTCNSSRVKSEPPEVRMYRRAKQRAVTRGLEFSIEREDVTIPEYCPILGIKLEVLTGRSGGQPQSPALDRKDSSKGYSKGNVWVISHLANMMKSSANKEQLKSFADWIKSQDWQGLTNPIKHK